MGFRYLLQFVPFLPLRAGAVVRLLPKLVDDFLQPKSRSSRKSTQTSTVELTPTPHPHPRLRATKSGSRSRNKNAFSLSTSSHSLASSWIRRRTSRIISHSLVRSCVACPRSHDED